MYRTADRFLALVAAMIMVAACSSGGGAKPQTLEQKAFGLYGTFVVAEEAAAKLVADPSVPEEAKVALRQADAVAKPAADLMQAAALQVSELRKADDPEALKDALQTLDFVMQEARVKIVHLIATVRDYGSANSDDHTP